jgi:ABC-type transporter Mla subunit MlaD
MSTQEEIIQAIRDESNTAFAVTQAQKSAHDGNSEALAVVQYTVDALDYITQNLGSAIRQMVDESYHLEQASTSAAGLNQRLAPRLDQNSELIPLLGQLAQETSTSQDFAARARPGVDTESMAQQLKSTADVLRHLIVPANVVIEQTEKTAAIGEELTTKLETYNAHGVIG